jgi:tripartite-type tricarboxylate transporter receptor subunit TctC
VTTWFALFGPAGVPQDALAAMEALARQVVESPGFGERLRESTQIEAHYVDAATLTQRIRAERARIAALVARLPAAASTPPPEAR